MFDRHRADALAGEMMAISDTMAAIAEEQRAGILANREDQLARLDTVATGVLRTQTQLVAAVNLLTSTLLEYFLDEERERGLGITE